MQIETGKLIMSLDVANAMDDVNFTLEVNKAFTRYRNRDWGEVKEPYKNDLALINEDNKILAKYITSKGVLCITSECDKSATTILFDYEC